MVSAEPPVSAPAVPPNEMPEPADTDDVAVLYIEPPEVLLTVPAPSVENTGLTVKVCVLEKVFAVVVPKAVEITGEVPPLESIGYVPVTPVTLPPEEPQSVPVPEIRPELLTWRHCVEPVIFESVRPPSVSADVVALLGNG